VVAVTALREALVPVAGRCGLTESSLKLFTRHPPEKVLEILSREVDPYPTLLRCILTLNLHYYRGRSRVCGRIAGPELELWNRQGPGFSLRAAGMVASGRDGGGELTLRFTKPIFPDVLGVLVFDRYRTDREVIMGFLSEHLGTVETAPAS
jgi:hypothetical protein